jgi:guanylate kinase
MSSSAVRRRGLLFVVSAPSGTGKTTLAERLVQVVPNLLMSRSFTSRPPRPGEADGADYHFVTRERFREMAEAGRFLEWAEIFGNFYGTSSDDTERALADGRDVVLVIDVQGTRQVRWRGVRVIPIFVLPPSFDVLEQRLRGRSKDPEDAVRRRLMVAREEVKAFPEYKYLVVNDDFDACVGRLAAIVTAERSRLDVVRGDAERIIGTFR